jgi:hypothetical protein
MGEKKVVIIPWDFLIAPVEVVDNSRRVVAIFKYLLIFVWDIGSTEHGVESAATLPNIGLDKYRVDILEYY